MCRIFFIKKSEALFCAPDFLLLYAMDVDYSETTSNSTVVLMSL